MDFKRIEQEFRNNIYRNEDDIKIHFHSDIVKPILQKFNPEMANQYRSEENLLLGGRTDATFQNISFELKKDDRFASDSGINEALYGRDERDHGLYEYIISNAGINIQEDEEIITKKILNGIGVGFDGRRFIFARFIPSSKKNNINISKVNITGELCLNIEFTYEIKDFQAGLKRLALILRQQDKRELNKKNSEPIKSHIYIVSQIIRDCQLCSAYFYNSIMDIIPLFLP